MSGLCLFIYRICFRLYQSRLGLVANILNKLIVRLLFSADIGTGARTGKRVTLEHGGLGVVIHKRAVVGDGTRIFSGVTIGGRSGHGDVPVIGRNVLIGTGAKILGPVKLGDNCQVGANAVVLDDVPEGALAVGVPARIIQQKTGNQSEARREHS